MFDNDAFERQVAGEIERVVGPAQPVDELAIFDTATAQTPQWRFSSMFSALKFATAALVLALVGGSLYFGLTLGPIEEPVPPAASSEATAEPTSEPTPPPTPEPLEAETAKIPQSMSIPRQVPKRIEGVRTVDKGQLATPIGRARWVRLFGADASMPDLLNGVTRVPGGYVVVEDPNQLWFSPDLLQWEQLPLPVSAQGVSLDRSGGELWLRTVERDGRWAVPDLESVRLWRSTDLRDWTEIDLSAIESPEPRSADWHMELGPVASNGRTAVVPVTYRVGDMSAALGLEERFEHELASPHLVAGDSREYVVEDGWGTPVASVRFEETPNGLRVLDATSGQELNVASDLDMDFVDRWATPSQATEHRFIVVDGTDARLGTMPDVQRSTGLGQWEQAVGVWEVDGSIVAFYRHPDGTLRSWTSDDGETWRPGATIGDDPDEPVAISDLPFRRDDGTWVVGGRREDGRWRSWASRDLSTWERLRQPWTKLGDHYVKVTADELLIETLDREPALSVPIGPMRKRERVTEEPAGEKNCGGGSSGTVELSPGLLVNMHTRDCRSSDIWMVQFDRFAR